VPEGFRETLSAADILCMRVLWFETDNGTFRAPATYPKLAVSCASTHDLPTLAGWWSGADIFERRALGLFSAEEEGRQREARRAEKRALIAALAKGGLIAETPAEDAPIPDWFAGAVYTFLAGAPSLFTLAQADDLAGETIATNLPGTDRERPNWRRRMPCDVDTLFSSARARAIIGALAKARPRPHFGGDASA
jgi:glycogen operon protein